MVAVFIRPVRSYIGGNQDVKTAAVSEAVTMPLSMAMGRAAGKIFLDLTGNT